MCRPALAQVDLDGVLGPRTVRFLDHDEVQREPAENALLGKSASDSYRVLADRAGVGEVSRETAAKVALPAGTAEQLVVRGQQFDIAGRRDPELNAGAAQVHAGDALLDDAATGCELLDV